MLQQQGYVVGADIGGTSLRLALAGMDGKILGKWTVSTAGIRDPHVVVRLIQEGVDHLMQQYLIPRSHASRSSGGGAGRNQCG
jgi:glucokinase